MLQTTTFALALLSTGISAAALHAVRTPRYRRTEFSARNALVAALAEDIVEVSLHCDDPLIVGLTVSEVQRDEDGYRRVEPTWSTPAAGAAYTVLRFHAPGGVTPTHVVLHSRTPGGGIRSLPIVEPVRMRTSGLLDVSLAWMAPDIDEGRITGAADHARRTTARR